MDSTGIEFRGDGEWQARKNGVQSRCQWRKLQLTIDAATSEIPAVEFTLNRDGNSPVQPDLLEQISVDENINTLTDQCCLRRKALSYNDPSTRGGADHANPK